MTLAYSTSTHRAIQQEHQYIAQTYPRPPFVLTKGQGMTVWDADGKAYLDFVAGIAVMALGHSDPDVTHAIQSQAEQLVHVSNLYYTGPQGELAAQLCAHSFADRVFFCNSGAEANEACIKFARKFAYAHNQPDRTEVIVFSNAFHGRTLGALSITPKPKYQDPFRPLLPDVTVLPLNDVAAAEAAIGAQTCAVVVEPVQGEGGIHVATDVFLQALRAACDQHGALLVFDEVQSGLGRTGTLWAHESSGVQPDLMAVAKPLAAGLPMGAALMTERVHAVLQPGDHGSTFAGGDLVASVALTVLQKVNTPEFLAHVREVSLYLHEKLEALESPHILEVRGRGLMLGIELDFPARDILQAGYDAGFLLVNAGPNVLRLVPPLIVDRAHIDALITFLHDFFQKVGAQD
ncbi:MAG: aspartate aminotransferase family protein [Chloroflexi bacterium]|nr:aspartate aminotransferase family protein [Chloroflexota bacterium]